MLVRSQSQSVVYNICSRAIIETVVRSDDRPASKQTPELEALRAQPTRGIGFPAAAAAAANSNWRMTTGRKIIGKVVGLPGYLTLVQMGVHRVRVARKMEAGRSATTLG